MGILKMEENRYIVNTDVPEFASLRESDRFLLNALCNGTFNAQKEGNWIYMLQKEAVGRRLFNQPPLFHRQAERNHFHLQPLCIRLFGTAVFYCHYELCILRLQRPCKCLF